MSENNLTKDDIAVAMSEELGISKLDSKNMVNAVLKAISDILSEDGILKIKGFGSFQVKRRRAKVGRNPVTMEEKIIPERDVVTFRKANWEI